MTPTDLEILARIHHAHANALQALACLNYDADRIARWTTEFEQFRELYIRLDGRNAGELSDELVQELTGYAPCQLNDREAKLIRERATRRWTTLLRVAATS